MHIWIQQKIKSIIVGACTLNEFDIRSDDIKYYKYEYRNIIFQICTNNILILSIMWFISGR